MRPGRTRLRRLLDRIRAGRFRELARGLRFRLASSERFVVLARDLDRPWQPVPSGIDFEIRPLRDQEREMVLHLPGTEPSMRRYRRRMLAQGVGTCWVAAAGSDICYVQFLCGPADNEGLRRLEPHFPRLEDDDALLEGAFTPTNFRRHRVMSAAAAAIAVKARDFGAKRILAVVGVDNEPSLRGGRAAGFEPAFRLTVRRRFFRARAFTSPCDGC